MEGTGGKDEEEAYKRLIAVDVDVAMAHVFEVFTSDGQYRREDLLNVYLFGSRLYGVATPDADYDLICIVEGEYFHGAKQYEETRHLGGANEPTAATGTLEVTLNLYHIQFFRGLLERNMINSLMCLCMPRECAWLERWPLPAMEDVLRVPALQKAVLMDSSHNLAKAKRLWFEGDTRKSKKNIVHGLRYLHYALQLADYGRITDYTTGNVYWRDIMSSASENWDDYERVYKPIYQTMMHQLKHNYGPGLAAGVGSGDDAGGESAGGGGLLTLDYIRRKGVQSLVKDLAIAVTPHPDLPALLHLAPDPTTSPADHPIVRECAYSLLVEEYEASVIDGLQPRRDWRVVAMGYTKIDHLIDPFTLVIDFPRTKDSAFNADAGASTGGGGGGGGGAGGRQRGFCWDKSEMRVLEKLDGKMALLYHYAGAWRVVSAVTPDASEPVVEELSLSKRTFKDWLTSITLHDEAEELAKRTHQVEEELRQQQRGSSEPADADAGADATSFAQLFWNAWNALGYALPAASPDDQHLCFVFEVMSPRQKLIVRRWPGGGDRIVLHGVRNMRTLAELDPREAAARRGWEAVREFGWREVVDASNWEDARKRERRRRREEGREEIDDTVTRIVRTLGRWHPLEHEGLVLCDANYNRLKIRAPQWAAVSLLNWFGDANTNERCLLELVRRGRRLMPHVIPREPREGAGGGDAAAAIGAKTGDDRSYDSEEFLEAFPEWRATYEKVERGYVAFIAEVEGIYARLALSCTDRAQFAREVKQYFFAGILLAWKNEEEDRRRRRTKAKSREKETDSESESESDEVRDARAEVKENEEWRGIDAWAYYGGWGLKRLIKDMRELEETGGRAGKSNPTAGVVRNNSQLNRLL